MSDRLIWALIAGMALTNLLWRGAPIALLSRLDLPPVVRRWLGYIPVTVMAAIVATQTITPAGRWMAPLSNPYLLAVVPTALMYRWTRSFLGATVTGMVAFLAFRYLLG